LSEGRRQRSRGGSDATDACTLLTLQQVSTALEVTSQAGTHISPTIKAL